MTYFPLSFCLFSHNGVYWVDLVLSILVVPLKIQMFILFEFCKLVGPSVNMQQNSYFRVVQFDTVTNNCHKVNSNSIKN